MGINDSGFLQFKEKDFGWDFKLFKIFKYIEFYFFQSQLEYRGLGKDPHCSTVFRQARRDDQPKVDETCLHYFKYLKLMVQKGLIKVPVARSILRRLKNMLSN